MAHKKGVGSSMLRPVIFWFVRGVLFIIPEKTWVLEKTIRCSHW